MNLVRTFKAGEDLEGGQPVELRADGKIYRASSWVVRCLPEDEERIGSAFRAYGLRPKVNP